MEETMKVYVVYDPNTGQIVHTHASYVLGNDEPVAADEEEVRALAPASEEHATALRVTAAPADFDIRSRLQSLKVDTETGTAYVVERDRPGPERAMPEQAS
jgi:hypothetical protein